MIDFIIVPTDDVWARDNGPRWIFKFYDKTAIMTFSGKGLAEWGIVSQGY
ncbi:hypothetical protein [Paenibacillus chitinolyticus]